jgi:hypothetical protein
MPARAEDGRFIARDAVDCFGIEFPVFGYPGVLSGLGSSDWVFGFCFALIGGFGCESRLIHKVNAKGSCQGDENFLGSFPR